MHNNYRDATVYKDTERFKTTKWNSKPDQNEAKKRLCVSFSLGPMWGDLLHLCCLMICLRVFIEFLTRWGFVDSIEGKVTLDEASPIWLSVKMRDMVWKKNSSLLHLMWVDSLFESLHFLSSLSLFPLCLSPNFVAYFFSALKNCLWRGLDESCRRGEAGEKRSTGQRKRVKACPFIFLPRPPSCLTLPPCFYLFLSPFLMLWDYSSAQILTSWITKTTQFYVTDSSETQFLWC